MAVRYAENLMLFRSAERGKKDSVRVRVRVRERERAGERVSWI